MHFNFRKNTYNKKKSKASKRLPAFLLTLGMLLTLCPQASANFGSENGFNYIRSFLKAAFSEFPTENGYSSTRDFIDLNLYDYNENINDWWKTDADYPGFQWNGGAYSGSRGTGLYIVDAIDFGNSKITDYKYSGTNHGKSTSSTIVGNNGGDINRLDTSAGVTNRPIGMSTGVQALSNTLIDGYPALKDGTSLAWLFTENDAVDKLNTESIDGLFKQDTDTGTYSYNSRENHAQYSNNMFVRYNQIITPNFIIYPFGNFLPLNEITDSEKATRVSDITNIRDYISSISSKLGSNETDMQLNYMLDVYKNHLSTANLVNSSARTVISDFISSGRQDSPGSNTAITDAYLQQMYNIDWDVDTNFFFGMDMSMNFMMPKDAYTGSQNNTPMVFDFTGDDDVWVYIDDVLFLDLSGIHRHVGGKIDFVNGMVYYYALDENTGDVAINVGAADGTGAYASFSFEELLNAAGKNTEVLNEKGTFKDYSSHEFKFFYMERGSGSSVCRINFNFPLLRKNSISVEKELSSDSETLGNPDYLFQILRANSDEPFIYSGTPYSVYDKDNILLRTDVVGENNVFRLKAGERAEFSGISENSGSYFVRELLNPEIDLGQYSTVSVSGEVSTLKNNVIVGEQSFTGMDSPAKDAADGANLFHFVNTVNSPGLGSIEISKILHPAEDTAAEFNVNVLLDGKAIPKGTSYSINGEADKRTVERDGWLIVPAGKTAVISNILAGTDFEVKEEESSVYVVSYSLDGTGFSPKAPSGTVKTGSASSVMIQNSVYDELPQTGQIYPDSEIVSTEEVCSADFENYMGNLNIPALGLELPVQAQWSYEALEISPCCYSGSIRSEDLVLLAHNYLRHFGRIDELNAGDKLFFTDTDGKVYCYELTQHEELEAWERERLCAGDYDLSLFTCTDDGQRRHVARFTLLSVADQ